MAPVFVAASQAEVIARLQPKRNAFGEFQSRNLVKPNDLAFVPFYRIYAENYAVYFDLLTSSQWTDNEAKLRAEQERQKRLEAATLDSVQPGFQQSEVEHKLQSENSSTGDFDNRKWRDARSGWFSYEMSVNPDVPMIFTCTYWGGESSERKFDILVDGQKVATQQLLANRPGKFFDESYAIPPALTKGKTKVTVRFQAHSGSIAGGLFEMRTIRSDTVPHEN